MAALPTQAIDSELTTEPEQSNAPFRIDIQSGVAAGFEVFYARNRDVIAKTLAFSFNDQELGFEAADEAMIRAYRDWEKVSACDNPEGWVFKVGLNWGRSWIRRQITASTKAPLLAAEQHSVAIEDLASDPDLAVAIGQLKPKQRVVVVLRFHRDYSVPQIAEILGLSEGTVKSRLSRALRTLAAQLGSKPNGEPTEES